MLVVCTFEIFKMAKMNHVWGAEAPGVTPLCQFESATDTEELFWEHKWLFISKIGHKFKHAVINYQHNIHLHQQTVISL